MTRHPARVLAPLVGAVVVAGLAACAPPAASTADDGPLVVLAASSLTDVVTDLADVLAARDGITVETGFAGSSALAAQVAAGAPADVVVTASPATTDRVTDARGGEPVVVAANRLQLAVPAGGDVDELADLADPDRTIALCAPEVPCGALTTAVLDAAGVDAAPDTLEPDARAVLTRLRLDEADAGLVYRTDVRAAAGEVEGLDLPGDLPASTTYHAVVLPDAPHPAAARAFVDLLTGPEGRQVLADAGFDLP